MVKVVITAPRGAMDSLIVQEAFKHKDIEVVGCVWVGVVLGWLTMGCPTGMSDARRAEKAMTFFDLGFEEFDSSFCLNDGDFVLVVPDCDTGGIISAVF